jgi:ABC-type sugar transport system substrate-binding protein
MNIGIGSFADGSGDASLAVWDVEGEAGARRYRGRVCLIVGDDAVAASKVVDSIVTMAEYGRLGVEAFMVAEPSSLVARTARVHRDLDSFGDRPRRYVERARAGEVTRTGRPGLVVVDDAETVIAADPVVWKEAISRSVEEGIAVVLVTRTLRPENFGPAWALFLELVRAGDALQLATGTEAGRVEAGEVFGLSWSQLAELKGEGRDGFLVRGGPGTKRQALVHLG